MKKLFNGILLQIPYRKLVFFVQFYRDYLHVLEGAVAAVGLDSRDCVNHVEAFDGLAEYGVVAVKGSACGLVLNDVELGTG